MLIFRITIPKGVKYIPHMVYAIGMKCKHTNSGMLCIPVYGMIYVIYMYIPYITTILHKVHV